MTETKATRSLSEIQQELSQAKEVLQARQRERQELPEKIKEAALEDRTSKAEAARNGQDVKKAGDSKKVSDLQKRESEVPLEEWAAALQVAELNTELFSLRASEVDSAIPEAAAALQGAREESRDAQGREREAQVRITSLEGQKTELRRKLIYFKDQAQQLEEAGPSV